MKSNFVKIGGLYKINTSCLFFEENKTKIKSFNVLPYIRPEEYFIILECNEHFPLKTKILFEFKILWQNRLGKVYLTEENLLEIK
jgi:hypothetical protein